MLVDLSDDTDPTSDTNTLWKCISNVVVASAQTHASFTASPLSSVLTNESNHDILDPITIHDLKNYPSNPTSVMFQDPQHDITFTHDFIVSEIEKFDFPIEGCILCSKLTNHFQNPRSLYDKLLEQKIIWIMNP